MTRKMKSFYWVGLCTSSRQEAVCGVFTGTTGDDDAATGAEESEQATAVCSRKSRARVRPLTRTPAKNDTRRNNTEA